MNPSIIGVTLGDGKVGANAPALIFLPKNSLVSQECVHLRWGWGSRRILSIFLNWPLSKRKVLISMVYFDFPPPSPLLLAKLRLCLPFITPKHYGRWWLLNRSCIEYAHSAFGRFLKRQFVRPIIAAQQHLSSETAIPTEVLHPSMLRIFGQSLTTDNTCVGTG